MNKQYMQGANSFETTGKQHPVPIKELVYHIFQQLYKYDATIRRNQRPSHNPYTDPIIYKTNAGKTIQIPTNVQKTAIASWIKKRHIKPPVQITPPKEIKKEEKMKYMPCIFAVIVLILMYYVGTRRLIR